MSSYIDSRITTAVILGASIILTACGGSSGGGPVAATIDDANKAELAVAATEGAKAAANGDESASSFGLFKGVAAESIVNSQFKSIATDQAVPQDFSSVCTTGTATLDIDQSSGNGSFSYTNCDLGGVIVNGSSTVTFNNNGSTSTITISANNLTFNYGGGVIESYDYSITCTTTSTTSSCTFSSSALGIDDRTYSISNANVSGDDSVGWDITATVTDPDHGNINISTTQSLYFVCTDGRPSNGEITVTSGSDTMIITFDDCTSFTVEFNGVFDMYNWSEFEI